MRNKKISLRKSGGRFVSQIQIHLEVLPAMDTTTRGIFAEITLGIFLRDREGREADEAIIVIP